VFKERTSKKERKKEEEKLMCFSVKLAALAW
jgi:hypothetical protein